MIIIYPHLPFSLLDGGTLVQYYLAKTLKDAGVPVKMFNSKGTIKNNIFNDYIDTFQEDTDTVVIYCEGIQGNPLNAKKVIRWMLSELGQNVPYDFLSGWSKKELVYFYGSEVRFKNTPSYIGTVYKTLNVVYRNPKFCDLHQERKGQCFTIRKRHIHTDLEFIHESNAVEIKHNLGIDKTIKLFNEKEIFISYDPITYLNTIAALCGCISIVIPIKGYSKNSWLQKTHFWDYINQTREPLYGIAYGLGEIEFAKSTLHLVREQQKRINEFVKNKSITMLLDDIKNFDNCDNTIQNVYYAGLTVLPILTEEITNEKYINTKLLKASSKKILFQHNSGETFEISTQDEIMLNTFVTNLSQPAYKAFQIDSNLLFKILNLKNKEWKYGLESQYNFFVKYYLHPHDHFIIMEKDNLVAYGVVKHRENLKILDSIIVDKHFRKQGYGAKLIQKILAYYDKNQFMLLCNPSNIKFYEKFGFYSQSITLKDKEINNQQVTMANFECQEIIDYNQDKLINDGIIGGITMVLESHLIFLTDYIWKNKCNKMVEIGVAKGGVLAICAIANPDMIIYGFDSWEGMPVITKEDDQKHKHFEGVVWSQLDDVYQTFKLMNSPLNNVQLVKGYVENTLPTQIDHLENMDILRLDIDWYSGTDYCIRQLYKLVKKGGLVIIDDYYFNKGCKKAIDDFRNEFNISDELYNYKNDGVYWFKN